jgi:hypothetical protein
MLLKHRMSLFLISFAIFLASIQPLHTHRGMQIHISTRNPFQKDCLPAHCSCHLNDHGLDAKYVEGYAGICGRDDSIKILLPVIFKTNCIAFYFTIYHTLLYDLLINLTVPISNKGILFRFSIAPTHKLIF